MSRYVRMRVAGGTYFFTVALLDRSQNLLTRNVAALRAAFREVGNAHPFRMDAVVVLPEHLHCIWTLPDQDHDFSLRWRRIKAAFSRRIEPQEHRNVSRQKHGERGIWQRRFWEHLIRDEADFENHCHYIHYNPVKHGHVTRVIDWEHSSFHRFVRAGLYPADWGASTVIQEMHQE